MLQLKRNENVACTSPAMNKQSEFITLIKSYFHAKPRLCNEHNVNINKHMFPQLYFAAINSLSTVWQSALKPAEYPVEHTL